MKKIYHITEDMSFNSGGVRTVLVNLDNYLNNTSDLNSTILSNFKEPNDPYIDFNPSGFKMWNYSAGYKNFISSQIKTLDVLHLHGVFMHPQFTASKQASRHNVPYIVSPHGMLEPWHLNDKQTKKGIYLKLVLEKMLAKSSMLHAITPLEKDNLFKLTKHKNIFEIPNFINYTKIPNKLTYSPKDDYILFLGRIHPKKGLDILLESMTKIDNKKIKLKIVGEENLYSNELRSKCNNLLINDRIEFIGSVFGDEKYALYANAKAFVAPSFSEAIGMVNLEAAICKTPVITTFNTGINPEWNINGGLMINPKVDELTNAINIALSWTETERFERGNLLSEYVINNYSWEKKGYLWSDIYESLT